jgi:tRNA threonylcarbamoyladenosine biosynthesis protein TsaB
MILNIETASDICSIALSTTQGELLAIREIVETKQHAAQITLLIQACLQEAGVTMSQLSAVALSTGPGSFTSLRVGAATAKGICYALGIPLIAVDTLKSLAYQNYFTLKGNNIVYGALMDARRMEVYASMWQPNEAGELVQIEPTQPVIIDENTWLPYRANEGAKGIILALSGNGASKCGQILTGNIQLFPNIVCSAKHLIPLSATAFFQRNFVNFAYFSPDYGKNPNITISKKNL